MISEPSLAPARSPVGRDGSRVEAIVIVLATLAIVALYTIIGHFDAWQLGRQPGDAYYNLLVRSFSARHVDLPLAAPNGLLKLQDPYDPAANLPYRADLHDLSFYRGKLYLYFGPTPVLLCFWPYHVVTGRWLAHRDAVILFCSAALLVNTCLWWEVRRKWRRAASTVAPVRDAAYAGATPAVSLLAAATGPVALGLLGIPVLLGRADVWEVPIACGLFLVAVFLFAGWRSIQSKRHATAWLALASLAYGLALGARPSLLPGAVALAVPLFILWRRRTSPLALGAAAVVPLAACVAALLAYNFARFGQPFEFGQRYQLAADNTPSIQLFSIAHAWHNLGTYLAGPVDWTPWFPFVVHTKIANPGDGRLALDGTFGILTHLPVLFAAAAAPVVWLRRRDTTSSALAAMATVVAAGVFGIVCLFAGACGRYEVEFIVPLTWLALVGGRVIDEALDRWRFAQAATRVAGTLLFAASVVFTGLLSFRQSVEMELRDGSIALNAGAYPLAARHYDAALSLDPRDAAANYGYGMALADQGRLAGATPYLHQAVLRDPQRAGYRSSYGEALAVLGRVAEGEAELRHAIALAPELAPAHQGLGRVLLRLGHAREGREELRIAHRLQPTLPNLDRDLRAADQAVPR